MTHGYIAEGMARVAAFLPATATLEESIARAQTAERIGYDSVWTSQMPDARDAPIVLAAYAAATRTLKLGTGVLPIYTRHPTAMAQMAASLDEMSGGRFILGIGISHRVTVEAMWGMAITRPVDAMRQYLTIVKASLRDGSADFEGDQFTARWRYSAPRRPDLPIMISALSPKMLELAGEMADGVVLWMCSPGYIAQQVIPSVRAGREKAGLSLEGFEVVAVVPACVTPDRAAALDRFRTTVRFYSNLPFYRKALDAGGFKDQLESGEVSDAMLEELGGVGDEAAVLDAVRRYREAGTTLPAIMPIEGRFPAPGFEATLAAARA